MIGFEKSRVRVLVCDDEDSIRTVVSMALKEDGWNVEVAENGKKGFEMLCERPFHIVLSDIQMPEMSGIELLEAGKKKFPLTEFIIMTSNATLETAVKAIKAGAYDYMMKPFEDISVVPNKMLQVAERIFLRQQNNELLKRLQRASGELKLLLDSTRQLNGILDLDIFRNSVLSSLPALFQDPSVRAVWLVKGDSGWAPNAMIPDEKAFEGLNEIKNLEDIVKHYQSYRNLRVVNFSHEGEVKEAVAFEVLSDSLVEIFVEEVMTCFHKVQLHQDIVAMANRDGLTKLHNHRYFQERLRQEASQVERQNGQLSLILMDVDYFKSYNDQHGHPAGDKLLKQLSIILDDAHGKRPSDVVARYGGEEFVMLLPFTPYEGAMIKAERIRAAVEAFEFDQAAQQPLGHVTLSIGVATFPEDAKDPSSLIEAADKALYEAKHSGRNRVVGFKARSVDSTPSPTPTKISTDLTPSPEMPQMTPSPSTREGEWEPPSPDLLILEEDPAAVMTSPQGVDIPLPLPPMELTPSPNDEGQAGRMPEKVPEKMPEKKPEEMQLSLPALPPSGIRPTLGAVLEAMPDESHQHLEAELQKAANELQPEAEETIELNDLVFSIQSAFDDAQKRAEEKRKKEEELKGVGG